MTLHMHIKSPPPPPLNADGSDETKAPAVAANIFAVHPLKKACQMVLPTQQAIGCQVISLAGVSWTWSKCAGNSLCIPFQMSGRARVNCDYTQYKL